MIRLASPMFGPDEEQAIREVLASGHLVQGRRVREFEERVAERTGSAHAVAMSSGTAALHASLLALGLGPGDVVVLPAFSFIATANVVELCGARPVFVDIDPGTFTMDPDLLDRCLAGVGSEDRERLRAVVPVHAFGRLADMDAIRRIAARFGASVVEDAACALGAASAGRSAGTWGRVGCFSLHPRKVITTGEGGVAVTDDPEIARSLRTLRNHGQDPMGEAFDSVSIGLNYRMTEIQGALGITQLGRLQGILRQRREAAGRYDEALRGSVLTVPPPAPAGAATHQSYVVLLPTDVADARAALIEGLGSQGIEATIGTWHMPLTTYFRTRYGYRPGDFPVTDDVARRALSLPLHERVTPAEQRFVADTLLARIDELMSGRRLVAHADRPRIGERP